MKTGPRVVGIVGWSGTGKTTLIIGLVGEFKKRGLSVAVIKHTHHGLFDVDDHTDSGRFVRAGSDVTVLVTPQGVVSTHVVADAGLQDVLATLPEGLDLVLVEGFKRASMPRLEVLNSRHFEGRVSPDEELIGIVMVDDVPSSILSCYPDAIWRWSASDTSAIADHILARVYFA